MVRQVIVHRVRVPPGHSIAHQVIGSNAGNLTHDDTSRYFPVTLSSLVRHRIAGAVCPYYVLETPVKSNFLGRRIVKRFIYSQLSLKDAIFILLGKDQPSIPFTVEADPPSVYFNFRVKPEKVVEFERYLALPDHLPLAPVRCLRDDSAEVLLTLNVYRVTGISQGLRAEWSTYVRDEAGKPRYMVVEARSSTFSMDPVDIITRASRVEHVREKHRISTCIESNEGQLFTANCNTSSEADQVELAGEWIAANDYIYWRNGVCDRTFYDAGLADAQVLALPANAIKIDDDTHWAGFLEATPKHTLIFTEAIDFMISPWWNV
jgi:hypothetical protein